MKTVLNIKTDVEVKKQAQKIARDIGLPLSTVVNAYLKEFIQDKRVIFSMHERPSARLRKIIEEARKDLMSGNVEGPFDSVDALMKSLNSK